ncbi:MAG TPA: hypothetical protein VN282_13780 [Pyrinomonadaceae bacterium]|nr:hypothetical protein [Pyrinomonadaceae bacterium]
MSDFLSRLARQALNAGAGVRPRLPSLFEPTSAGFAAAAPLEEAAAEEATYGTPSPGPRDSSPLPDSAQAPEVRPTGEARGPHDARQTREAVLEAVQEQLQAREVLRGPSPLDFDADPREYNLRPRASEQRLRTPGAQPLAEAHDTLPAADTNLPRPADRAASPEASDTSEARQTSPQPSAKNAREVSGDASGQDRPAAVSTGKRSAKRPDRHAPPQATEAERPAANKAGRPAANAQPASEDPSAEIPPADEITRAARRAARAYDEATRDTPDAAGRDTLNEAGREPTSSAAGRASSSTHTTRPTSNVITEHGRDEATASEGGTADSPLSRAGADAAGDERRTSKPSHGRSAHEGRAPDYLDRLVGRELESVRSSLVSRAGALDDATRTAPNDEGAASVDAPGLSPDVHAPVSSRQTRANARLNLPGADARTSLVEEASGSLLEGRRDPRGVEVEGSRAEPKSSERPTANAPSARLKAEQDVGTRARDGRIPAARERGARAPTETNAARERVLREAAVRETASHETASHEPSAAESATGETTPSEVFTGKEAPPEALRRAGTARPAAAGDAFTQASAALEAAAGRGVVLEAASREAEALKSAGRAARPRSRAAREGSESVETTRPRAEEARADVRHEVEQRVRRAAAQVSETPTQQSEQAMQTTTRQPDRRSADESNHAAAENESRPVVAGYSRRAAVEQSKLVAEQSRQAAEQSRQSAEQSQQQRAAVQSESRAAEQSVRRAVEVSSRAAEAPRSGAQRLSEQRTSGLSEQRAAGLEESRSAGRGAVVSRAQQQAVTPESVAAIARAAAGQAEKKAAAAQPAESTGPPVIRITIGRVEVRAVTTNAAQPPAPRPARAATSPSLEEYLKGRNGGRV